jgi:DNA-binding beta-propeller fold protein YncE
MAKSGKIEYSVVEGWEQLPKNYVHRDVAGVAVDGEDRVYLMCRGDHPVLIYDRKGKFLRSWGEGDFSYRTHGIYVAPNGTIFCTDDGQHTVRQFTPEGKLLMTMGTKNTPSNSGYDGKNLDSITHGAGPFNRPTNVAIGPKGDIYITDGYGNARVHVFSAKGQLKRSWGEPGKGPGQFHLPHGIAIDSEGRVYVCDREADRIQIFSPDGEYLSEWKDTQRPTHMVFDSQGRAYVTELAWHEGDTSYSLGPITKGKTRHARMSVYDKNGKLIVRWGTPQVTAPGSFAAPHGLALDSNNDLYVSEVTWTFAVSRGRAPADCHTFQKFSLKSA